MYQKLHQIDGFPLKQQKGMRKKQFKTSIFQGLEIYIQDMAQSLAFEFYVDENNFKLSLQFLKDGKWSTSR